MDLCKPMDQGGLGLSDLLCFNQALLAKLAWRAAHCTGISYCKGTSSQNIAAIGIL